MPGRKYEAQSGYRYGFNGKEKDKDMNSLTAYDYGFRIYNPGIGKFLSVDPLTKEYPWNSTYAFAENDVIRSIDLDGLEKYVVTYWYDNSGKHRKTTIRAIRAKDSKELMDLNFQTLNGDLTTEDVWVRKLFLNGGVKEAPKGKKNLSSSEHVIFHQSKVVKVKTDNEDIGYTFEDENNGSETVSDYFDQSKYEYFMSTKFISDDISLLGITYIGVKSHIDGNSTTGVRNLKNGDIDWGLEDARKLKSLLTAISTDNTPKKVTIKGTFQIGDGFSQEQLSELNKGIENLKNQLTIILHIFRTSWVVS